MIGELDNTNMLHGLPRFRFDQPLDKVRGVAFLACRVSEAFQSVMATPANPICRVSDCIEPVLERLLF